MKEFLLKGLNAMTILSLVFMSNIVLAQEKGLDQVCEQQVFVSAGGENDTVAVSPIHEAWTASIGGAEWVWSENPIADPVNETTVTFTRTFNISGDPADSTLEIAADNSYKVSVNGNPSLFEDSSEDNFSAEGQDSYTILAGDLVSGLNTIEFEVKNLAQAEGTAESNPAGLMYKITVNCTDSEEPQEPVCIAGNLVDNGGFENPDVTSGSGWELFANGTPNLGWTVSWVSPDGNAPETANLELHGGVNGWLPNEGSQYAELDTDYGTPAGGAASVLISQDIDTVEGIEYQLSYAFSARPDTASGENSIKVYVDGNEVDAQGPVAGAGANAWTVYTVNFTAESNSTEISFKDVGTPNSVGTFLDNVSVNCDFEPIDEEPTEPSCDSNAIWARVNTESFSNEGIGDVTGDVYVGSNSNVYSSGEWFLIHDGTNYITDPDITGYEDVEGIAIQRMGNGQVRLSVFGNNSYPQDSENIKGNIEFFNGTVTAQASEVDFTRRVETSDVNPIGYPANFVDSLSYINDKSNFDLHVSDAIDAFYTTVSYSVDEDCANEPTEPSCDAQTVWARIILETSNMEGGAGDVADMIYLGSTSNTVAPGVWFNTSILDANTIDSFADVEGIAVRREAGKIVLELHGSNPTDTDLEFADGYIEFFNGTPTLQTSALGQDKIESVIDSPSYPDSVWISGDKSYFDLQTGIADDRFTTDFVYSQDESCDDNNDDDCIENCNNEPPVTTNDNDSNSSSSGSRRSSGRVLGASTGEVLGACVPFSKYHSKGDVGGEVAKIQEFLNEQMGAGITVDGVYGDTTVKAVHAFQQKYFTEIITPWVPSFMARTTGKWYKTTRMMANELIACPEAPVFLEDPQIIYKVKWQPSN